MQTVTTMRQALLQAIRSQRCRQAPLLCSTLATTIMTYLDRNAARIGAARDNVRVQHLRRSVRRPRQAALACALRTACRLAAPRWLHTSMRTRVRKKFALAKRQSVTHAPLRVKCQPRKKRQACQKRQAHHACHAPLRANAMRLIARIPATSAIHLCNLCARFFVLEHLDA